jgi:hypothetical protein
MNWYSYRTHLSKLCFFAQTYFQSGNGDDVAGNETGTASGRVRGRGRRLRQGRRSRRGRGRREDKDGVCPGPVADEDDGTGRPVAGDGVRTALAAIRIEGEDDGDDVDMEDVGSRSRAAPIQAERMETRTTTEPLPVAPPLPPPLRRLLAPRRRRGGRLGGIEKVFHEMCARLLT